MRNQVWIIALLILFACEQGDYAEPSRKGPFIGVNNALVYAIDYIEHQGNSMKVAVEFAVLNNTSENTLLPDSVWMDFAQNNLLMEVEEVQDVEPLKESYAGIIAMDQSADWNEFDAFNLRTTSIYKAFVDAEENPENETALAAFTRGFNDASVAYTYVSSLEDGRNAFQQSAEEKGEILFNLYDRVGKSSNVYDALDVFLDYSYSNAINSNKQITLLCLTPPDAANSITSGMLINKANSLGIRVNIVILGGGINWSLANVALRTGGYLNIVSSTDNYDLTLGGIMDKGNSTLLNLDKLSLGMLHRYRVVFNCRKTSGQWESGNTLYARYQINATYQNGENRVNNYLPIYVQVP
jgi:hypothetical protein